MPNPYAMNRYSPAYYSGVATPPKGQVLYDDKPIHYPYNPPNGELTANQFLPNDTLAIQANADFILFGYYFSLYTGLLGFQITDSTGYQLSTGLEYSSLVSQDPADPTVLPVAHFFPANGKLLITTQDYSGAANPFQLVFVGINRYRVQK